MKLGYSDFWWYKVLRGKLWVEISGCFLEDILVNEGKWEIMCI